VSSSRLASDTADSSPDSAHCLAPQACVAARFGPPVREFAAPLEQVAGAMATLTHGDKLKDLPAFAGKLVCVCFMRKTSLEGGGEEKKERRRKRGHLCRLRFLSAQTSGQHNERASLSLSRPTKYGAAARATGAARSAASLVVGGTKAALVCLKAARLSAFRAARLADD